MRGTLVSLVQNSVVCFGKLVRRTECLPKLDISADKLASLHDCAGLRTEERKLRGGWLDFECTVLVDMQVRLDIVERRLRAAAVAHTLARMPYSKLYAGLADKQGH